jgi:sulfite reductase alpha subunit-like flavoprotein
VYGFLEVVAKTGRAETNSGSGAASIEYRPWEEVHRSLGATIKERRAPYADITAEPHETRGTFDECSFKARIVSRQSIDEDPFRKTAKVTIDISNSGVTFAPGDRMAVMPLNSWSDMEKIVRVCNLSELLDTLVPLDGAWQRYSKHLIHVYQKESAGNLYVRDILRRGKLAPLTKEIIMKVHL